MVEQDKKVCEYFAFMSFHLDNEQLIKGIFQFCQLLSSRKKTRELGD